MRKICSTFAKGVLKQRVETLRYILMNLHVEVESNLNVLLNHMFPDLEGPQGTDWMSSFILQIPKCIGTSTEQETFFHDKSSFSCCLTPAFRKAACLLQLTGQQLCVIIILTKLSYPSTKYILATNILCIPQPPEAHI